MHIIHLSFNFPFKLEPNLAYVLYMSMYYMQDFMVTPNINNRCKNFALL